MPWGRGMRSDRQRDVSGVRFERDRSSARGWYPQEVARHARVSVMGLSTAGPSMEPCLRAGEQAVEPWAAARSEGRVGFSVERLSARRVDAMRHFCALACFAQAPVESGFLAVVRIPASFWAKTVTHWWRIGGALASFQAQNVTQECATWRISRRRSPRAIFIEFSL